MRQAALGLHADGRVSLLAAARASEAAGDNYVLASSLSSLADVERKLGMYAEAEATLSRALSILRTIGRTRSEAIAWIHLGLLHGVLESTDEARRAFLYAAMLLRRCGPPRLLANALLNLTIVSILEHRAFEASCHADEAVAIGATTGDTEAAISIRIVAATAWILAGRIDEGLPILGPALDQVRALSAAPQLLNCVMLALLGWEAAGDHERLARGLAEARTLAEATRNEAPVVRRTLDGLESRMRALTTGWSTRTPRLRPRRRG